jgi:hypothetical protein
MSRTVAPRERAKEEITTTTADALTAREWMIIRFYRGLDEPDRRMMERMMSALATARAVLD